MKEWQKLLDRDIKAYIKDYEDSDPAKLALSGSPNPDWPFPLILEQIKLRSKAKTKLPEFHGIEDYLFISRDLLEQASSQACAKYKASLLKGETFCDLTAGHGVDAYYIAQHFKKSMLVERDENSAQILQNNFEILAESLNCEVSVIYASAEDYIQNLEQADCFFLDPQRREGAKKGIFDLSITSPDVLSLLPLLKGKAKNLLLKTSPFLDIFKSIEDLKYVHEVHIVQYQGDCKEVLYLLDFKVATQQNQVEIFAVDIDEDAQVKQKFSYKPEDEQRAVAKYSMPLKYIYEAGPAFMKSGGFKSMANKFGLKKLHPQTHLYTSDDFCGEFTGKSYEVLDIKPPKSKEVGLDKADLAVRNYPDTVENLRKKLKIKDGGTHRIYACTLMDNSRKLVICKKN